MPAVRNLAASSLKRARRGAERSGMHDRRWLAVGGGLLTAVLVAAVSSGVTLAATKNTGARACVNNHQVLHILHDNSCQGGYHQTTIGQRGPRGERGAKGIQGPIGPSGKAASASIDITSGQKIIDVETSQSGAGFGLSCYLIAPGSVDAELGLSEDGGQKPLYIAGTAWQTNSGDSFYQPSNALPTTSPTYFAEGANEVLQSSTAAVQFVTSPASSDETVSTEINAVVESGSDVYTLTASLVISPEHCQAVAQLTPSTPGGN
jgi:hypothetical protein